MKILVTGATGFVGRHVVAQLLADGHTVTATTTNSAAAKSFAWFGDVQLVEYQLSLPGDDGDLFAYFGRPDALIHLAWQGLPNYKATFHLDQNLFPQYLFLKNLVQHGLQQLTVTGTCFEYGMQSGCLSETLPALAANPYALAKDSLRRFLESLQTEYSFGLTWARLFYMYGDGQNPKSLLPLLDKAIQAGETSFNMSGGEQLRDYLPVETVARYLCRLTEQQANIGLVNCCSGLPVSVRRLVETYLQERNVSLTLNLGYYPYPDYEPMAFWGDATKLRTLLID